MNKILQIVLTNVIALLFAINAFGQVNPPSGLCADVLDNGDVFISWDPPVPMDPFWNFEIFKFTADNGFTLVQTVGAGSTSWTDFGANGDLGSNQYYMQTTNGTPSSPTPTISTIYLDLSAEYLGSVAVLEWNPPFIEMTASGEYKIQRNINGLGFSTVAILDSDATTYRDTLFGLCTDDVIPITYKVTYSYGGCTMNSQQASSDFRDLLGPPPPTVETITTDPFTGDVTIYWYPSDAPDISHYIVQRILPSGEAWDVSLGLPWNIPTDFTYTDASETASTNLVVLAYDTCENNRSYSDVYTTMFAESAHQECGQTVDIWWNPYLGWPEGLEKYELHVYKDGVLEPLIDAGQATSYELDVDPGSTYTVYVEAFPYDPDGLGIRHSTSNMTEVEVEYPQPPSFNYINRVTTNAPHEIQIDLKQDLDAEGATYELKRSKGGSSFRSMGTYSQVPGEVLTVIDYEVDADVIIYTYKWLAFDGCGQELFESNEAENMVVEGGTGDEDLVNFIQWNAYIGWDGGVQEYQIFRRLGLENDFEYHATVMPGEALYYQEDVEEFMQDEGLFCYKVVAIENLNSFGKFYESTSNEACVTQEPIMWIPNTIVINGFNDEFAPVAGFINFSTYEMEIHNKGGEQLFYTDDVEIGWKGLYEGRLVREDYYMYTIVYRDGAGQHYVKRGPLYVLRAKKP